MQNEQNIAEYQIYVPLCYNDGSDIEDEKIEMTYQEVLAKFGALTRRKTNEGIWRYKNKMYKDRIEIISIVTHDTPSNDAWFYSLKAALAKRFNQEEIFITKIKGVERL